MRVFELLILISMSVLAFGSTPATTPTIWHGLYIYYYKDAKLLSKQSHKPILLYFYGNNCTYCDLFDQYVLENQEVVNYLNKNFIFASVNVDESGGHRFVEKFGLFGTPAFSMIYPNGKHVVYQGYKTKEQFLYILNKLKK